MELQWYKCQGGVWCELNKIDLSSNALKELTGVYILWTGQISSKRTIIKVGSGKITDELLKNKRDLAMMAFFHLGLYVTWAEVPALKRRNVQYYLTSVLQPKFEEKVPDLNPIQVNLPW